MVRILWAGKGHLNNNYAGVDGGSNIRIPLINELASCNKESLCEIDWTSFYLNADLRPSNIDFLGLSPCNESCENSVSENLMMFKALDRLTAVKQEVKYDAVVLEVRPSWMFEEAYLQNKLIKAALKHNIAVILLDQDLWAEAAIDASFRQHVLLMRPYEVCNSLFPHQEFYPYHHHTVDLREREPEYDIVYIGNRYERDVDFIDFMRPIHEHGLTVLMSGDWVLKAPYVVREFPKFHWVGSTLHSYTLPLLQLGRCTVHIGRKVMRQRGLTPIRPFEAYMADRVCFVLKYDVPSYIYHNHVSMCNVHSGEDIVALMHTDRMLDAHTAQSIALSQYSVQRAAAHLVKAIKAQQELIKCKYAL